MDILCLWYKHNKYLSIQLATDQQGVNEKTAVNTAVSQVLETKLIVTNCYIL